MNMNGARSSDQDQLSSSAKRKNSGKQSSDEDINDVVDEDQMERKRHREKKRRFEITHAVERLSKTMVKIDPDAMKTSENNEFDGGTGRINGKRPNGHAAGSALSQSFHRSLNRTDVISSACDLMERLYKENQRLKEDVRVLTRNGNLSDQARNGISAAVADGAGISVASSSEISNRDANNATADDAGSLLKAIDYVSKNKNAPADTRPAHILQQQQQSQLSESSSVAAAEQLMMRPTHGSSSSARLLQQQAVAATQNQQQKNDMLQQLSMQIQQLQQQQQVSSMHQSISSSHPGFSIQGILPHAGTSMFGVGGNGGGYSSLPPDNAGMNFGSMAAPLAQSEDWNQLVLRSLQQQQQQQQQQNSDHISIDQLSNAAFSNNGTNNTGGYGGSGNGNQSGGYTF
jgi:hypothetical protein|eukprot:scaffold1345_cov265-Chaetoceros_neogracile.AAC.2